MKKYLVLLVMVLACQMGRAQQVSDLFSKYAGASNAECVSVSSLAIKFVKLFATGDDAKVLRGINSLKVLSLDECSDEVKERFCADVNGLQTAGYEPLVEVTKNSAKAENMRILLRMKDDVVREMLIVAGGDDCALVQIKGKMSVQDVVELAESSKKGNGRINISF